MPNETALVSVPSFGVYSPISSVSTAKAGWTRAQRRRAKPLLELLPLPPLLLDAICLFEVVDDEGRRELPAEAAATATARPVPICSSAPGSTRS